MKYFTIIVSIFLLFTSCNKNSDDIGVRINKIIEETANKSYVHGLVVHVESPKIYSSNRSGDLGFSAQYFIASTTKLYTSAIIYQLIDEGQLGINDKISAYLDAATMDGLHVYKGKNYSNEITIKHLLSNTSGLPDYFEGKGSDGKSLVEQLTEGIDQSWTFDEAIARSKTMNPEFEPGKEGKAFYSDTNFQLLGKIIENVTGLDIKYAFYNRIFEPLDLKNTYLYTSEYGENPKSIYYKDDSLMIPKAMASFKADGGIVSNIDESMIFLKAFFTGGLFDIQHIENGKEYNNIFFPNEYGIGFMRYKQPGMINAPELLGHSGLSGAFAWYCPEKDAFITGTVNQIHRPGTSYKMVLKIMNEL